MLPETVPSYLQPISPHQRAELDIQQQELGQQAASDASRLMAQSMEQNRRKAATKAMLSDAEIAHMLGEEADTAALTSFKKHATDMGVSAEQMMGTISQMEAKIDARKKVEAYRKRYSELREKDMDDFDASAQAYNETLVGEGKDPSMSINRMLGTVGQRDYHRAMIHQGEEKISNQLGLAEKRLKLGYDQMGSREAIEAEKIESRQDNTGKSVQPKVQVIGGREFIVNPKTGRYQELERSVSKAQFINQHLSSYVNQYRDKAMDKLNEDWKKIQDTQPKPKASDSAGDNTMPDPKKVLKWDPDKDQLVE